jgi:hypothetical protein
MFKTEFADAERLIFRLTFRCCGEMTLRSGEMADYAKLHSPAIDVLLFLTQVDF